jgi:hypothetical protein
MKTISETNVKFPYLENAKNEFNENKSPNNNPLFMADLKIVDCIQHHLIVFRIQKYKKNC